jgi:hypothetical protein
MKPSYPFPLLTALLSSLLALGSPPALANDGATGTDSPQVQYRKAHEAIKAKNWSEARRLLLDLWARAQTYDVSSSLVYVENQAQNFAAAANYASFAIRNAPPIEKPEEIERLRRALDELKPRVGTVTVSVSRPGAEVRVDSELAGTSPLAWDVYVDVGPHQIEARLADAPPVSKRVDALAGESYRVNLTLAGTEPGGPVPGAAGSATDAPPPDGSSTTTRRGSYAPAIVAASVGGVGLVGGIMAFVVSANKHADADDRLGTLGGQNPCGPGSAPARAAECSEISELADSANTFRALGFVGLGTAVAGGALTYALWPRTAGTSKGMFLSPSVATTGHGFFATVRCAF